MNVLIEIDRNFTLYGCSIDSYREKCYGCLWNRDETCVGKEIHANLMAKVGHIGDIDYDIPLEKPKPETSFGL